MDRRAVGYTCGVSRRRAARWAPWTLLAAACEVAPPDDDVTPFAVTESGLAPCAPSESAYFAAEFAPAPADERIERTCEITGRGGGGELFALELACDDGPAQLVVEVAPAPASDGLFVGQTIAVTLIRAPGELAAPDVWLRVADAKGRLLLAYVAGSQLQPPDATGWATPFSVREAPTTCMVEETACGARQRGAVDLQLSGGPPLRLFDGTSEIVGDKGSFVAHVAAAEVAPVGSGCPRRWQFGLLARR